jgi:hypothetical protein
MQPAFNEVALLCYDAVTGGPEAIHQLSHAINALGGRCGIAYIGGNSSAQLVQDGDNCTLVSTVAANSPAITAYAKYKPQPISEMALRPDNLLIVPEPMADLARNLRFGTRAVWWLSVDNAIAFDPRLGYQSYRDFLFSDHSLLHFYQSDYARDFLLRNRARQIFPLFDYTDEIFLADIAGKLREKAGKLGGKLAQIAYFPRKGAELAAEFIASAGSDLRFAPIENMSKGQVKEVLETSAIYIDFGHHPGKDRVPREAAISGAVILLHDEGSASHFLDHPLDSTYLFSLADIRSGELAARVREIISNCDTHFERQRYYRQKIVLEREEFTLQVKTFFFGEYR